MEEAYAETVHWRMNFFRLPFGSAGQGFVQEMSRLLRAYANGSALEAIALKACSVMPSLLLQKPSHQSRPKDNLACLKRRLVSWKKGDIEELLSEGRILQASQKRSSHKGGRNQEDNLTRTFSRLMFQGKTSAAIDLLAKSSNEGILKTDDRVDLGDQGVKSVLDILRSKHPCASPASTHALPFGSATPPSAHPVIFEQITARSIRSAALNTKGSAGPSGLDAHRWRRLCSAFKTASNDLCHSLALLAKRLCTTLVDPKGVSPLLACRLIALNKCPGVRPIGICETPRRIIAKAVLQAIKYDIMEAVGPRQLCAGQIAGIDAAVHGMRSLFSREDTEAVLLVDASNAFNSLNREVALRNIQHLCPSISNILINTYRVPTELFVDSQVLWSEEGTTQGDPFAMPMYALATIPLIDLLSSIRDTTQVWYADDASVAGGLSLLRNWWDRISTFGPAFGYHPNARKTWLVVKEQYLSKANELFSDTEVQITTQGRPYLGAPLGSEAFTREFASMKIKDWHVQLLKLVNIAATQPHATYSAFMRGFVHKITFLSRTTPSIDDLLQPLEETIQSQLIPAWTGMAPPNAMERELFALPACLGGLGISNLITRSSKEYLDSVRLSSPLSDLILLQQPDYPWEALDAQISTKQTIYKERKANAISAADAIKATASGPLRYAMTLAQEKGASAWLTSLPIEEFGFALHKGAFRDALALRYGWLPSNLPSLCACGTHFSVEHALSCPKGGFPQSDTMR